MSEYWIQRNGRRLGPFSELQIVGGYQRGIIAPEDLLWADGLDHWIPAEAAFAELNKSGALTTPQYGEADTAASTIPANTPLDDAEHSDPVGMEDLSLSPLEPPDDPNAPFAGISEAAANASIGHDGAATRYAGFWTRLAAFLVDSAILSLLVYVAPLTGAYLAGFEPVSFMHEAGWRLDLLAILIAWLYFAVGESRPLGATIGKHMFWLHVKRADAPRRIGFLRASARLWLRYLSMLILFIGYLMQPFTPRKQALHDLLSDTVVLARRPSSAGAVAFAIIAGLLFQVALVSALVLWALPKGLLS